jgi:hypothetical protein
MIGPYRNSTLFRLDVLILQYSFHGFRFHVIRHRGAGF